MVDRVGPAGRFGRFRRSGRCSRFGGFGDAGKFAHLADLPGSGDYAIWSIWPVWRGGPIRPIVLEFIGKLYFARIGDILYFRHGGLVLCIWLIRSCVICVIWPIA